MAFDGFTTSYSICPSGANVFSYNRLSNKASSLPVLVLLHGYPQNALMYKHFVKEIPSHWNIIVPDLPGYGNSTKPIPPNSDSRTHSKRAWGEDILSVADTLCGPGTRIIPYGHDRGARVAYRLALDHPERIAGAAVLDIVPGSYVWDAMRLENGTHAETKRSHHWIFLSSPRPLPETMISFNPEYYFRFTMSSWTGSTDRPAPGQEIEWVEDSIAPFLDPENGKHRIAAACEDYRAGSTHDINDDYSSSLNPLSRNTTVLSSPAVFTCTPLLVLFSSHLKRRFDVNRIWQSICEPGLATSIQVGDEDTGHFLVNERQAETGKYTREWLRRYETQNTDF